MDYKNIQFRDELGSEVKCIPCKSNFNSEGFHCIVSSKTKDPTNILTKTASFSSRLPIKSSKERGTLFRSCSNRLIVGQELKTELVLRATCLEDEATNLRSKWRVAEISSESAAIRVERKRWPCLLNEHRGHGRGRRFQRLSW
ncbi:hypothetical protein H5410_052657 [Solanum commersonii]|uniref:Uncharacterized protein n=1 Tax=Solanum commersonii TaxID=4109 RepID=A0A9J5X481_SOLCO|nr:hypothetical protein H5410_052657 [Solanum commersonii]